MRFIGRFGFPMYIVAACACSVTGCWSEENVTKSRIDNNLTSKSDIHMQSIAVGMDLQAALAALKNNMVEVDKVALGGVRISERDRVEQYVAKPIYESDDALVLLAREQRGTGSHKIESLYWHIKYDDDNNRDKASRALRFLHLQSVDVRVLLPNENTTGSRPPRDVNPFE